MGTVKVKTLNIPLKMYADMYKELLLIANYMNSHFEPKRSLSCLVWLKQKTISNSKNELKVNENKWTNLFCNFLTNTFDIELER